MNQLGGYKTAGEVAEYYHVSLDTLRYWRHVGKGPLAVRPGKDLVYPVAEIERYDAELLAEATARAAERNPRRPALQLLTGADGQSAGIPRSRRARTA